MKSLSSRQIFLTMFLVCAGLLGYGYYLQYAKGLEPCPLCIFQRVCYAIVGLAAMVAAIHNPYGLGKRFYAAISGIGAIGGLLFAGRQTWLQHLPPDQVPSCGPGLEYWMKTLSFGETVRKVFRGTGDCAEVTWTFLGLSIAEWSLLCFAALLVGSLLALCGARMKQTRA
ncbi:MAG: disulfide bond formation protein B [Gammaproteobacteria bacterium]